MTWILVAAYLKSIARAQWFSKGHDGNLMGSLGCHMMGRGTLLLSRQGLTCLTVHKTTVPLPQAIATDDKIRLHVTGQNQIPS